MSDQPPITVSGTSESSMSKSVSVSSGSSSSTSYVSSQQSTSQSSEESDSQVSVSSASKPGSCSSQQSASSMSGSTTSSLSVCSISSATEPKQQIKAEIRIASKSEHQVEGASTVTFESDSASSVGDVVDRKETGIDVTHSSVSESSVTEESMSEDTVTGSSSSSHPSSKGSKHSSSSYHSSSYHSSSSSKSRTSDPSSTGSSNTGGSETLSSSSSASARDSKPSARSRGRRSQRSSRVGPATEGSSSENDGGSEMSQLEAVDSGASVSSSDRSRLTWTSGTLSSISSHNSDLASSLGISSHSSVMRSPSKEPPPKLLVTESKPNESADKISAPHPSRSLTYGGNLNPLSKSTTGPRSGSMQKKSRGKRDSARSQAREMKRAIRRAFLKERRRRLPPVPLFEKEEDVESSASLFSLDSVKIATYPFFWDEAVSTDEDMPQPPREKQGESLYTVSKSEMRRRRESATYSASLVNSDEDSEGNMRDQRRQSILATGISREQRRELRRHLKTILAPGQQLMIAAQQLCESATA